MTVLVTGGAGYIGAHVVELLASRGDRVVVVDDLSTGRAERVSGIPLVELDLAHTDSVAALDTVMRQHEVRSVIHFAARKQVGESVARPAWYFGQNVGSLANVLLAMEQTGVSRIVFSSSAAVYGASDGGALAEDAPTVPINPYGQTKLVGEWLVADAVRAHDMRAASLRYFNVAGAGRAELGDPAVLNLVPMVFEKLDEDLPPLVFGDDYNTPDGTCIRDYIHVSDLADAHLATLDSLEQGEARHDVYNVGTGTGSSVKEVVDLILEVSGADVTPEIRTRRPGDPDALIADPSRIQRQVGWSATRGLREIVTSAWESHVAQQGH